MACLPIVLTRRSIDHSPSTRISQSIPDPTCESKLKARVIRYLPTLLPLAIDPKPRDDLSTLSLSLSSSPHPPTTRGDLSLGKGFTTDGALQTRGRTTCFRPHRGAEMLISKGVSSCRFEGGTWVDGLEGFDDSVCEHAHCFH